MLLIIYDIIIMSIGMDTTSILKKIIQLKKVSVQLKQSTQQPQANNNATIKGFLELGKSIVPMDIIPKSQLSSYLTPPKLKQHSTKISKQSQLVQQDNFRVFDKIGKNKNSKQLSHSQYALQSSFIANRIQQQQMSPTQQINHLRQQNHQLEQQIQVLKQKLIKLQQIERQQVDQEWRIGLPYFSLSIAKIKIFYTKLTIAEKDYDKIDYSDYSVDLGLEKIVLNQLPQPGLSSRPPKSITLMLSQLKQVSYIARKISKGPSYQTRIKDDQQDKSLIVYSFKYQKNKNEKKAKSNIKRSALSLLKGADRIKQQEDSQIIQTLFMKFDNDEVLKQWDLAIFVNYKIVQQLTKSDMKEEMFNSNSNQSQIRLSDKKTQNNRSQTNSKGKSKSNQKLPFDKLVQKFQSQNNVVEYIKQTQSESSKIRSDLSVKKQQKKQLSVQNNIMKKLYGNDQGQLFRTVRPNNNNNIKIRDQIQSPTKIQSTFRQSVQSVQTQINKQRSDTSHFGTAQTILNQEQNAKKIQQQRIRGEQIRKQKIIELEEQKRKQFQRMEALRKTQFELSIKRAKQSLRRGYNMTKYARYALNPHEKRVYLNEDGRRLCWQDIKSTGEPKWITIAEIDRISQGQIGKGIQAHAKYQQKINEKGCFVVIHLKSQDRKALQLKSSDIFAMQQFCKQLQLYRGSLIKK